MKDSESSGDWLECEVGGYIVRARRADAWDAIVTLLVALDAEHGNYFHAVMQGCRRLSNSRPEIDGLDDLLLAPEQHLHDVAIERERRRSQQGYATPADARAFLEMARQPRHGDQERHEARSANPIVTAYFRRGRTKTADTARAFAGGIDAAAPRATTTTCPESIEAVMELLTEAGVMPERPRALLEAADDDPQSRQAHALAAADGVRARHDETAYFTRSRELAFLANTLLAGCSVQSRPFTPQEASDAAASICNLGLETGPRVAGRDLAWSIVTTRTRHGRAARLVPDRSRPRDRVRSGLVGAAPGCEPVRGGTAHLDADRSSTASIATSGAGSSRCGARS